jgi:hypothetical protein
VLITRIRIGAGRLNIFLFVFSIASIKGGYYEAGSVDLISKIYSFIIFYLFSRRHSETIPLEKAKGG